MSDTSSREFHMRILAHRLPMKNLPRPVGELYLDRYLPDLDEDEREYMLDLCGQKLEPVFKRGEPKDPVFCAAMFMAGVSQGDLAALFGVRKQTIQVKIYAHTTKTERDTLRENPDAIDLEAVAVAREMYYLMVKDNPSLNEKSATELGRILLGAANSVMAQDRGEEPLPSRPRRYSNMNKPSGKEEAARLIGQLEMPEVPTEPAPQPTGPANTVRPEEQSFLDSL